MANDLTTVSYVTLALIGRGGASAHDLVDMHRRGGSLYYSVAASRQYAEPKRLEALGYVVSEKRPGKTRERTFYTLTEKGIAALRAWALEAPAAARIQNETVVKLLCGDLVADDERLLESVLGLRAAIDEQAAGLDRGLAALEALPHRSRYLVLAHNLGRRLLQAQREWLEDVERELGPSRRPGARP